MRTRENWARRLGLTTQYRLVAERRNGASVSSPPFTPGAARVTPVETVRP